MFLAILAIHVLIVCVRALARVWLLSLFFYVCIYLFADWACCSRTHHCWVAPHSGWLWNGTLIFCCKEADIFRIAFTCSGP